MSVERITLDTNILVYAVDKEAGRRHEMAIKVLQRVVQEDCILILQVLSEFFNVVTRKGKLSIQEAGKYIQEFIEIFPVVAAKQSTLKRAITTMSHFNISFWDAMLWSTARDARVTILLSEDFQHTQLIDGVRIVNPFFPNDFWNI